MNIFIQELVIVASRYRARGSKLPPRTSSGSASSYTDGRTDGRTDSSDNDPINAFRDKALKGTLEAASMHKPLFKDFLADHGLPGGREGGREGGLRNSRDDSRGYDYDNLGLDSDKMVEYGPFVSKLVDILEGIVEHKGGLPVPHMKTPWTLREFDIVDTLICQVCVYCKMYDLKLYTIYVSNNVFMSFYKYVSAHIAYLYILFHLYTI